MNSSGNRPPTGYWKTFRDELAAVILWHPEVDIRIVFIVMEPELSFYGFELVFNLVAQETLEEKKRGRNRNFRKPMANIENGRRVIPKIITLCQRYGLDGLPPSPFKEGG